MMIPPVAEIRGVLNEKVFNETGQNGWFRYSDKFEIPTPKDIVFWVDNPQGEIVVKQGKMLEGLKDYSEVI